MATRANTSTIVARKATKLQQQAQRERRSDENTELTVNGAPTPRPQRPLPRPSTGEKKRKTKKRSVSWNVLNDDMLRRRLHGA
jgi:hypothetical protein